MRKFTHPLLTKDWLAEQYVTLGKSAKEIGAMLGCKNHIIWHRLEEFGIPARDTTFSDGHAFVENAITPEVRELWAKLSKEVLTELYIDRQMSIQLVADCLGCNKD